MKRDKKMEPARNALLRVRRFLSQLLGHDLRYNVQVSCTKKYLGSEYGRYCICPDRITRKSIIYSFGVGEDISFDLSIIKEFGANIYAFDPTPKSIDWVKRQELPKEFCFFNYGIADHDGSARFNPPENPKHVSYTMLDRLSKASDSIEVKVHRLKTILNILGHQEIDILKMDIEGAEYAVIDDLIASDIEIHQLLVEFHHRFENTGISQTKRAIESLSKNGFRIFDISLDGQVYSFIQV